MATPFAVGQPSAAPILAAALRFPSENHGCSRVPLTAISARYEKGSIILTSNKHVRDWPEIFASDEVLATAILDRLLHHVHVVHINGRSYWLRELQGLLQGTASSATPRSQSPEESRIPDERAA